MEMMKVQRRTTSGLEDVGEFPLAIVESGENANGWYVKFADGTMICWGTQGMYIGDADTWLNITKYFPVKFYRLTLGFVDIPLSDSASDSIIVTNGGANTERIIVNVKSAKQSWVGSPCNIYCLAIGRWK